MPTTYSTQFLLLFSQLVHESAILELTADNFKSIRIKLKNHPIVTESNIKIANEAGLLSLYKKLLLEYGLDPEKFSEGSEVKNEQNSDQLYNNSNKVKKPPVYATKLCEYLYLKRIEELKKGIEENGISFKEQLEKLNKISSIQ
ncbi:hypothetical protein PACTADRAFT_51328 [Pachysolen tannophilus NRRL Y-2460]|uniref:Uncharacterized protein n=1 Tax=Pachysolen tannophilus NRRL Y-2460 TaxID=669874 RepID=A0A1E4TRZ2_PACTA|nr:hypothetical protein PACTADRAFT_52160 [Pachysolen tannophilus NRRL Y-2460]ODV94506.1 hypothetical protein PACTADRAFT_51328 [Pachysolen tannophilus NRRL Y-2460]